MATKTHGTDGSLRELTTSCPFRQAIISAKILAEIQQKNAAEQAKFEALAESEVMKSR